MDKSTRTILIVIAAIVVLGACTVTAIFTTGLWSFNRFVNFAEQSVSENPEIAVRIGGEIADFEIPQGFGSPYGLHYGDLFMLVYTSQNERSHILLARFPQGSSADVDEMLQLIEESTSDPNSIWYNTETTLVEQIPVTIRGQETMLSISEGTSSNDITYRSATAPFQGRGGPALVMVAGPLTEWDQEMVEEFLSSIQ